MDHSNLPSNIQHTRRLKPIAGIPVKIWVPILWAFILFFPLYILFTAFLSCQTTLSINSYPQHSLVFWKGELIGHTPVKMKITQPRTGLGQLTIERQGFQTVKQDLKLSSWIFPLSFLFNRNINVELEPVLSEKELLELHLKELSYWACQGEPKASRPFPKIFSDFVQDFKKTPELCRNFLKEGFLIINSRFLWKDFATAYDLMYSQQLSNSWESWLSLKKNLDLADISFFVLYLNAKSLEQQKLSTQSDVKKLLNKLQQEVVDSSKIKQTGVALPSHLNGYFSSIPSQYVSLREEDHLLPCINDKELLRPSSVFVNSFYISRLPVSKKDIKKFLQANPFWKEEYRQALMDKNLVDENYMKGDYWSTECEEEIAYFVSYYLAQAYADWYSQNYLKGTVFQAKLPSSFQWLCLQDKINIPKNPSPFGQWFWMRDPHISNLAWLRTPNKPYAVAENFPSWEGEIRALPKKDLALNHATCASLPRHWCSPYLSFYLVLERKENNIENL